METVPGGDVERLREELARFESVNTPARALTGVNFLADFTRRTGPDRNRNSSQWPAGKA
jgi:hypothetical protein